jgi:membrane peptidoglycan carboxypeptidase
LLALPFVGGVALFAKSSADHFLNLPSDLLTPPLPESSVLLAGDGSEIARLRGTENRVIVKGAEIPEVMRQAIVAIEDARFYSHSGVDPQGVFRAALRNREAGDVTQGGSTLTQQYVKNVLLQTARTADQREAVAGASVDRKLQELRYAVELEKRMTKDEILVGYLNIAYFGDGAYGVGTAAQHYFGVPASRVSLDQAALLAGLVQSPSRYDPANNPRAARERRNIVLDRMAAENYVTVAAAEAAKKAPVKIVRTTPTAEDSCVTSTAPFFCDYIRTSLLADPALGATEQERSRRLLEGGLKIRTTLDPKVQAAAQQAVDNTVDRGNRVSATEVVVRPGTGDVLAMAVNRTFGANVAANETKVSLPMATNFQTGSTFKAFTLAAALEDGYGYNTTFYSPSCYVSRLYVIGDNSGRNGAAGTCSNGFSNADPAESGSYDLVKATEDSVNTYYIQLLEKVGIPAVVDMAQRLGVPPGRLEGVGPNDGSLTIGSRPVSPLDMANSYATLAAHGLRCKPRAVLGVVDSSGAELDAGRGVSCRQAVSAEVADTVTDVLSHVITSGTGYPKAAYVGRPAAGKTGTTDGYSAAWFVGYTPQLAAAVVVADPIAPVAKPLRRVQAAGRTWAKVYGGDLPAMIWGRTMRAALDGVPVDALPDPDPSTRTGTKGGVLSFSPNPPPPTATPANPANPGAPQPGQPGAPSQSPPPAPGPGIDPPTLPSNIAPGPDPGPGPRSGQYGRFGR